MKNQAKKNQTPAFDQDLTKEGYVTPVTPVTPVTQLAPLFLTRVTHLAALGTTRQAIFEIVKADLEVIDKETKAVKEALVKEIKTLDIAAACAAATILCPTISHASDAERKRVERRRKTLKDALNKAFPTYDTTFSNSGKRFSFELVGDQSVREAKKILAVVAEWRELNSLEDVDALAAHIRGGMYVEMPTVEIPTMPVTQQDVLARIRNQE